MNNLDEALANCMKCGFCKAACPVSLDEETNSPRAKVRLARGVVRGEIELGAGVKRQMERCLGCRACASECPSGVEPNRIALAMRGAVVERDGLPLAKKLIFHEGLTRPGLMAAGSSIMGLAQMHRAGNPVRGLLPLVGMRRDRYIPKFGQRTLMASLPVVVEPRGERKITVVYFPGCAVNLVYPEAGRVVVELLSKLGARVVMPRGMVCCSTPVFSSGDLEGARELVRRNIDVLSGVDAELIVTSCGSCGLTIKREWLEVLGVSEAASVAAKVVDIHEFIARYVPDGAIGVIEGAEKVTYHDSCHLRRGLGVYREPRELLRAALGNRFVEMEQAERCCGGGGTFCLSQPELSQRVAEVKMECLSQSAADVVSSGCPACNMQFRDSIIHRNMPQQALHSIEIINRALRVRE